VRLAGGRWMGALFTVVCSLSACTNHDAAPAWLETQQGAFPGAGAKLFATGFAEPKRHLAIRREAADREALARLDEILRTFGRHLLQDYRRTTGQDPAASEGRPPAQVVSYLAELAGRAAEIADRWEDPTSGHLHSLALVDAQAFAEQAASAPGLSERLQRYLNTHVERVFAQFRSAP